MSGQRVLVIGAGFLGRALACRLAGEGAGVSVLSPRADAAIWPAGVAAVPGRQEDAALLAELIERHDMVIHAAWGTTPGASAGRPAIEAEKGLNPFLAFLETLQRFAQRFSIGALAGVDFNAGVQLIGAASAVAVDAHPPPAL